MTCVCKEISKHKHYYLIILCCGNVGSQKHCEFCHRKLGWISMGQAAELAGRIPQNICSKDQVAPPMWYKWHGAVFATLCITARVVVLSIFTLRFRTNLPIFNLVVPCSPCVAVTVLKTVLFWATVEGHIGIALLGTLKSEPLAKKWNNWVTWRVTAQYKVIM